MWGHRERRVIAVIPARGGSKGLPLKNLAKLRGETLIAHVGRLAHQLDYLDARIVSTDHPGIANAARDAGLGVPFIRPPDLSGDLVGDFQVMQHALIEMEKLDNVTWDVVVMLQPTCPLRKPEHVTAAVKKLIEEDWDSVWTVSRADLRYHPLKHLRVYEDDAMDYYTSAGRAVIARQQLRPTYIRNGAAYAFTRECLLFQQSTLGKRAGAVVIEDPLVNIDTAEDLAEAERLMGDPPVAIVRPSLVNPKNRAQARTAHDEGCRVPHGGSECSCAP